MATSSITKQFIAKDTKAFEELLKDKEKILEKKTIVDKNTSLNRGRMALKKFKLQKILTTLITVDIINLQYNRH